MSPEKEPVWQSVRFWTMLGTIASMLVLAIIPAETLANAGIAPEQIQNLVIGVAVAAGSFIIGRTLRNTRV